MRAEIFHQSCWINSSDTEIIIKTVTNALNQSFNVIGMLQHSFTPHGFTCVWLLSESHLAVHSFPEEIRCYIELSSCSSIKSKMFWELFFDECKQNNIEYDSLILDEKLQ
jgi:S-adenosylmethionine decarboxylase